MASETRVSIVAALVGAGVAAAAAAGVTALLMRSRPHAATPATAGAVTRAKASTGTGTGISAGAGAATAKAPAVPREKVELSELRRLASVVVAKLGYVSPEADTIVDVLMYAQLRDNSQGIVQLATGGVPADPSLESGGAVKTVRDSAASALIDGGRHIGMHVLKTAADLAMDKAAASGIAIVGTVNTASTTGALGYYAKAIADAGFVGLVWSQSPELVAPHGSFKPFYGTNPMAAGFPTEDGSFVFDIATSAMAYFGLMTAFKNKAPIASDVAFGPEGRPTNDAASALEGALRSFDRSHKGSGLALVFELLTGALTGGAPIDKLASENWGNLVIVISPTVFRDSADELARRVSIVLHHLRSLPPVRGGPGVRVPGERGDNLARLRKERGWLEVESPMLQTLRDIESGAVAANAGAASVRI